jgi:hypothetical protein
MYCTIMKLSKVYLTSEQPPWEPGMYGTCNLDFQRPKTTAKRFAKKKPLRDYWDGEFWYWENTKDRCRNQNRYWCGLAEPVKG